MSQAAVATGPYSRFTTPQLVTQLLRHLAIDGGRSPSYLYEHLRVKSDAKEAELDTLRQAYEIELSTGTALLREVSSLLYCLLRNSNRLGMPEEQRVEWVQQFGQHAIKLVRQGGVHDVTGIALGFAAFRKNIETSTHNEPLQSSQKRHYNNIICDAQIEAGRVFFASQPDEALNLMTSTGYYADPATDKKVQDAVTSMVFEALADVEHFDTFASFHDMASMPKFIQSITTAELTDARICAMLKGIETLNTPARRGSNVRPTFGISLAADAMTKATTQKVYEAAETAFDKEADKLTFSEKVAFLKTDLWEQQPVGLRLFKKVLDEASSPALPETDMPHRETIALVGIDRARAEPELYRASVALLARAVGLEVNDVPLVPSRPADPAPALVRPFDITDSPG